MRKIFGLILLALTIVCITSCGGNKYTITLKKFDDESTITAKKGEVVELEPVEVEGYLFIGWYNKNDELVEKVTVKENITFTAKFIEHGTSWNISYDLAGGEFKFNPSIVYQTGKELVLGDPSGIGNMEFLGWELNGEIISKIPANMYGDIKLIAKWTDNNVYHNIEYVLSDEIEMPEQYVTKYIEGFEYTLPVPKIVGYFFRGWYTDENFTNRVRKIDVTSNVDYKLYPQFVKKIRSNAHVSFLGDSITTYEGTIPEGFPTYYPAGDVNDVEKTWWKLALKRSNCIELANNSYSGSYVSQGTMYGASINRLSLLAKDGVDPDTVVIYMGTNDLTHDIKLTKFKNTYIEMIENIKLLYDDVDIFVLTMPSNTYAMKFNEPRIKMNEAIREIAETYGLFVVDLEDDITADNAYDCMYAGAHPNAAGMSIIGKEVGILLSREYGRYWYGE